MIRNLVCALCFFALFAGCGEDNNDLQTPEPELDPEPEPEPICMLDDDCDGEGFCNGEGTCVDENFVCGCNDECGEGRLCGQDELCFDTPRPFRFVLLEDQVNDPRGDLPGIDVDTISLLKRSGEEIFASEHHLVEVDCDGNLACDEAAALGPPDAFDRETGECFGGGDPDYSTFMAFNGGRVIVSFGDAVIENWDQIRVYEVGSILCNRFDNDDWGVTLLDAPSIEDSNHLRLGIACSGCLEVEVSGLFDASRQSRLCEMPGGI